MLYCSVSGVSSIALEILGLTIASASVSDSATAESWPSAHTACNQNHHSNASTAVICSGTNITGAAGNKSSAVTTPTPVASAAPTLSLSQGKVRITKLKT